MILRTSLFAALLSLPLLSALRSSEPPKEQTTPPAKQDKSVLDKQRGKPNKEWSKAQQKLAQDLEKDRREQEKANEKKKGRTTPPPN